MRICKTIWKNLQEKLWTHLLENSDPSTAPIGSQKSYLWKRWLGNRPRTPLAVEVLIVTREWQDRCGELGQRRGGLSGPLNRLNAILSPLHPLDCYRTPSAIGSAIGRPLSRPISHPTQVGVLNRLVLNRLGGSTAR